jgi:hypothetical protein
MDDNVRADDLLVFRRSADGIVHCRALSDIQLRRRRRALYRARKGRGGTIVFERFDEMPPAFGDFDFRQFTRWILRQYKRAVEWMEARAEVFENEIIWQDLPWDESASKVLDALFERQRRLPQDLHSSKLHAADMAYLGMLALALQHSIIHDVVQTNLDARRLVLEAQFRRARWMLLYHRRHLPVRLQNPGEESVLDERAGLVGNVLLPVALDGFTARKPLVPLFVKQLPRAVHKAWQCHEHRDHPLCQMMALSFHLAFRGFAEINGGDWRPVISAFWEGWVERLLHVKWAIENEHLAHDDD